MKKTTPGHKIPKASSDILTVSETLENLISQLGDGVFTLVNFFATDPEFMESIGLGLCEKYPEAIVIGCTAAGVIDTEGYNDQGVSAFALPSNKFRAINDLLTPIDDFDLITWRDKTRTLITTLSSQCQNFSSDKTFAFLLVDGTSQAEETVLSAIYPELGDIPLFGGSAGDDLQFAETKIFCNGQTVNNGAVLILVNTDCPFKVFRTQHFKETDRKMVITDADPQSRTVHEINAAPATREYARLIGVPFQELSALTFAKHPVMVRVGGAYYARSIQRLEGCDGLKFFCAIDKGLVLTLAEGKDMTSNLIETMHGIRQEIGVPELVIGCDCIFRKLELKQKGQDRMAAVSMIFKDNNLIGFSTYGEQYAGMHVNQTLTGVAIGWSDD